MMVPFEFNDSFSSPEEGSSPLRRPRRFLGLRYFVFSEVPVS